MSLVSGTKLGPYEIVEPLGAGGMGEVYRGRDKRLERTVAIKVLPAHLSNDPVRKQRFEHEAKTISSLNHPHICVLHDVGHQDGLDYLVMECLEGETLAKRLERGPLLLEQALKYSAQIADALDKAHRSGVIHRDLKPGNIMITPSGAKLLDFGLAKPAAPVLSGATQTTLGPRSPMTDEGTIVGTFQYMSPEQVDGKELDGRSDIFSLGAVLYEMVTGKKAFEGKSQLSVASSILEKDPQPISTVKPTTPPTLDHVVSRCLAKNPEERWQSGRDLKWALELAIGPRPPMPARASWRSRWVIGAVAVIIASAALWSFWPRPQPVERIMQFRIEPPPGADFIFGVGGGNAISPDGRMAAFVAASAGSPKLWIRSLDSMVARELPGTDNAQFPFWSPDSKSLGFFGNGRLQRLDLTGGPPVTLAPAPNGRGAAWSSKGAIIFAPNAGTGLWKVSENGGPFTHLTVVQQAQGENTHRWPLFLADGQRFIYYARGENAESGSLYLSSLEQPQARALIAKGIYPAAAYSPARGKHSEYLYWLRERTLMAQPFDSQHGRFSGDAVAVSGAEAISSVSSAPGNVRPSVSVSNDGTILFGTGSDRYQLTWFNREGKVLSTVGQPDRYVSLRLSPNGKSIATVLADSGSHSDLWLVDLSRAIPSRLTFMEAFGTGAWSPDAQRIGYHILLGRRLLAMRTSGGGQEETVLQSQSPVYLNDWSPDARYLVYTQLSREGRNELWLLSLNEGGKPIPFLQTSFNALQGEVSPDSKWIAYTSDESGGLDEVYATSFPSSGAKWRVSSGGGSFPRWSRNGKELFYRALNGMLMVASVREAPHSLEFGTPSALFRISEPQGIVCYPYDIGLDGQRILTLVPSRVGGESPSLTVLVSWDAKAKP
ncbi:MAG TPA: protein kinase [Candidatus Acidoferrum sp.]|nr:protein kinase [Candidatus Acidoferrum sp.]